MKWTYVKDKLPEYGDWLKYFRFKSKKDVGFDSKCDICCAPNKVKIPEVDLSKSRKFDEETMNGIKRS